jgi:hypothetical protein
MRDIGNKIMSIIEDIIENDKNLKEHFDAYKDKFWENKVDIVARIAAKSMLMPHDLEYWNQQPCVVLSIIYNLYREKEQEIK